MDVGKLELSAEQLRRCTDPAEVQIESTEQAREQDRIIGQERAVRSIEFGVKMPGQQYNITAVGQPGSGRTTIVQRLLNQQARERPVPKEWCYVHNFEEPRNPRALSAPAGRATRLRKEMEDLINQLREDIPRTLEGELYEQRQREIQLEFQSRQQELIEALESYLNERGFTLIRSQMGLHIAPVVDGQPISSKQYEQLPPERRKELESHRPELMEQFDATMRKTRELDRERRRALEKVRNELVGFVIDQLIEDIREQFQDCPEILEYLGQVRNDVVDNADEFMPQQQLPFPLPRQMGRSWFNRYAVNVLAESRDECAPVIIEDNPTYPNLIGRIEHRPEFGTMVTDFTQIRAGALHRANGGYLVVEARNLLSHPMAWDGLKRALRNREIKIEEMAQFYGLLSTSTLEPEPIPLSPDTKVVIISDELLYQLLNLYDEDFRDQFKVKAEFHATMARDAKAVQEYTRFVADVCRREGLPRFDATGVARIIDEASRMAEDQNKLTTRMADVADLIRQSVYWAEQAGHSLVTAEDVGRAVGESIYRVSHIAERFVQRIGEGVVLISTEGTAVGQVNGLSIIQLSDFRFGVPSRVTARTFAGKSGVVSIDREVKMSGPIHDKGQLILSAWFANHFAQRAPLSMSATLTFEQSYSGVEGDSAASTELYALLSSLSGIPIRQNLAVTGSVNQAGEIQAIGGVNAKIEGFFDVCKSRGLTGDQGVLVPSANVQHLMLREDVLEAARRGAFHIYSVNTVEQGIELLTGVPAGEMDEEGNYPEDSIFGKVQRRLEEYARASEPGKEEGREKSEFTPLGKGEEEEPTPPRDEPGPSDN